MQRKSNEVRIEAVVGADGAACDEVGDLDMVRWQHVSMASV